MSDWRKKSFENGSSGGGMKDPESSRSSLLTSKRTVKQLRLSKSLTIMDSNTVYDACQRMASRRVDAVLLTDSDGLLSGILTDKDIAIRVVARRLHVKDILVSKVMTRNPLFVTSDAMVVEALQNMVKGKFRHLPVVENGEVTALLDMSKCLCDAIAHMERAAKEGRAIASAVDGVEKLWGASVYGPSSFIETLRQRMLRPSLSTFIKENSKVVNISPTDSVLTASKKMLELRLSSAVVTVGSKPRGILTSKDILMRVVAQNLSPYSTPVEKVMTPDPVCATVDTPVVEALHIMHDGEFSHLPILDKEGRILAVIDVIHITSAAVAAVGNAVKLENEVAHAMMQKFWEALGPLSDDEDTQSEGSVEAASEEADTGTTGAFSSTSSSTTFFFKLEDRKGQLHRLNCETRSLADLISALLQRVGDDIDQNHLPQILYEDEDQNKHVLGSDNDLAEAVDHARLAGLKAGSLTSLALRTSMDHMDLRAWKAFKFLLQGLRLHLDYKGSDGRKHGGGSGSMDYVYRDARATAHSTVAAGAALVAGLGVMAYLKRSNY